MSGDVTGPRWVGGVNTPASGGGDYEPWNNALREAARRLRDPHDDTIYFQIEEAAFVVGAEWARKALAADKRDLLKIAQEANDDCKALIAERAALRAQLEGMTVEKTTVPQFVRDTGANHLDLLPRPRGHFEFPLMRRLVGPWTAVEEGDDQ